MLLLITSVNLQAQTLKGHPELNISSTPELDQFFSGYKLNRLKNQYQKSNNDSNNLLAITLDDNSDITLSLSPSNLLSENYKISYSNGNNEEIDVSSLAVPYIGYVQGDPSSSVRITIEKDYLYGYIFFNQKKYYIEPASTFDKSLSSNMMIVYTEDQVKKGTEITCASSVSKKEEQKTRGQLKMNGGCQLVDLAIAIDYSYRQDHGGSTGAINQTIAVMNMVAGVYEGPFTDDIRFEIVEHFVSNCGTCDPWTSSSDAVTLLNDFSAWAPILEPSRFTLQHDIGQLWTNRNLCGNGDCSVAGLAWINAVCGNYRYHILEDFTGTAWQLRVLVSHEMGHNFGSYHDGGNGHIMAPSISVNTTTWSASSIGSINTALQGFNCFEDCINDSCSEILDATTSNCTPGNPGSYDLTLEIRHGGGGPTSTSFDVNVNGQSFAQNWETSPQTVIITGLIGDGTIGNVVTLAANDGSDAGCAGSYTYDEPVGDCKMNVLENFDNCAIPNGWTESSTNIYSWNNGDPLVQYEWKFDDATRQFANYNNGNNASSLKTIDGSCMALFDDDIINHSLYTGSVTLTTSTYDVADFDTVKLKFDYNFHPFEDGGKGANNSYFKVEIYNGNSWVSVLTDSDSSCPWYNVWPNSCANNIELDITGYRSADLQVRFIYNDGNDGRWTGMIALDNVVIYGAIESSSATCDDGILNGDETDIDCGGSCEPCVICHPVVTVSGGENAVGYIEARDMINTSGSVSISQLTTFAADVIEIFPEFEVNNGTEFSIISEGCED